MLMDTNIPRVLDLRKCRLCFEEENRLIYIYEVSGCLKNVAKAITDVLNYEISIEDQFPPFICICCCGKLLEFRAFKVKCDSLRERFKLLLKSRKDAANSIQEKVEIEEESLDKDEQMFDTIFMKENSGFDKYQVEIEEESLDKDQQMFDTNVIEENSAFDKYQVEIEEESLDIDEQMFDTNVIEENSAFDNSQEQDRALRCRKAVKYNVDQSGSEASDSESSDSFCPSNQGDTDGSDDSLSSDGNERMRKRSQVCRENAGLATVRNNPASGAAGLEEVADGRSGQIGCDPGTLEGCTGESSAISPISSGNNGYSGCIVGGTSQMSRPWVGLTCSDAQRSSVGAEMTTSQSDLRHNVVNMSSEHFCYSVQTVGNDSCVSTTNDPVQLTNESLATEIHSVTNISLEYPCRNVGSGKENIASHPSESITLKDLLKVHSFSPKGNKGSLPQSDTLSCPRELSLSWRDLLENEVASSSRMASSSQTTSVCPSIVDVSGERVMCNDDSSGCTPSRIDSQCILQGRNSVDSAVMKQSFSEQRNGQGSMGEAEKRLEQNGLKGRLYPGISTIDLKSFGISLETDVDDPVDGDSVGSNTQGGDESLGLNAKEGSVIRSESDLLGFAGSTTYATGHVQSSASSRYPNDFSNVGATYLPLSAKEGLMTFQQSKIQAESSDITVLEHFKPGSVENHPKIALRDHSLERVLSVGNSGCVVNSTSIQRKELTTVVVRNEETGVSRSTTPSVITNASVRSGIAMGSSGGNQGYPSRVCDGPGLATSEQIATVHAKDSVASIDHSKRLTDASEMTGSLNRSSVISTEDHIINTNYASSRQVYLPRDPPTVQPSRMNSYNNVSQCLVAQEGPSSGVLNFNSTGKFDNRNVAPLDISGNFRSTYSRPVSYSTEQFLSACQRYVFPSTSRYVSALANLVMQPEMRNSSQQSLSASLVDLTLPKKPWEIVVLAKLLLQPEMRRNSLSASQIYDLLSTPRYTSASTNHVSQPEMRRNSLSSSEIYDLLSRPRFKPAKPVSQPETRKKISDVERDDESTDSVSSTADAVDDIEDDFAGETPVTKKTQEYLCDVCGSVYYNAMSLRMHRKGVHGEKRFKCSKCPKAFTLKHHLQQHMSMHDDSRPFVCKECGSRFKLKTHLRQHVVVHSKKAMFQCSHCDKGFHTKWQHDNHQRSHEGNVVWSCDGCTEKLTTWAAYQDHLLEHKKNRTFKCDMCSNAYNTKADLKRHVMGHIKPVECTVCAKRFARNKLLVVHLRVHTGERPYACKFCGKRFSRNEGLKVHLRVHSDVRPFKCRFCDYGAKVKSELKRHEKIHLRYLSQNFISPNVR